MNELRRRLRLLLRRLNMFGDSRITEYDYNAANHSGPHAPGDQQNDGRG